MNPRTLGSSIWLLTVGAATVLLIGAFARFDTSRGEGSGAEDRATPPVELTAVTPVSETPAATPAVVAATLPSDLSPGLAEIIKLAQSHIPDDTILAFVQNSGKTYNPTADEILYLSDLGVSETVMNAMFKKADLPAAPPSTPAPPALAAVLDPPPPATAPPASDSAVAPDGMMQPPPPALVEAEPPPLQNPQESYFYDSLAPYGSWVRVAGIGWCWQPMVSSVNADWMPYRDRGHWAYTDDGWYWASDYSWGWAAFHYGRWSHDGGLGWVWVPGDVWAPAWVAWRNTDTYSGWAPLPPGARFRAGFGLFAAQGQAGFKASFGVSASWFTFVPYDHFQSRNVGRFAAPAHNAAALFKSSTPVNNYSFSGQKILNVGVSADLIAAVTQAPVRKLSLREASSPDALGGRSGGQSIAVYRPKVSTPAAVQTPANAPAKPVLINKQAHTSTVDETMQRAFGPRQAAANTDYNGETPRPGYYATAPARTGFSPGNFQPSARYNQTAVSGAPAGGGPFGGFEARRPVNSSGGAPVPGYAPSAQPSYSPRSYNSVPSGGPAYSAMPRSAPAAAPAENRSGSGEVSRSTGSTSSSTTSSSSSGSSKTTK